MKHQSLLSLLVGGIALLAVPTAAQAQTTAMCSLNTRTAYKSPERRAVWYVSEDCKKRPIRNPDVFFSHFDSWDDVVDVTDQELAVIDNHELGFLPWGVGRLFMAGSLIKTVDDPNIYWLRKVGNEQIAVPIGNEDVFAELGFSFDQVEDVTPDVLAQYDAEAQITSTTDFRAGLVFKYPGSPEIYRLERDADGELVKVQYSTMGELRQDYRADRISVISPGKLFRSAVRSEVAERVIHGVREKLRDRLAERMEDRQAREDRKDEREEEREERKMNDKRDVYTVTIENLTSGQPFSPPVVVTHDDAIHVFQDGSSAIAEVIAVAEDGDGTSLVTLLEGLAQVTEVVYGVGPIAYMDSAAIVNGARVPDTQTMRIHAEEGDVLSAIGMLICTNDGFFGLDNIALPGDDETVEYEAWAYDAGSEDNTEVSEDIVDACSALGPLTLSGDDNGNDNQAPEADPQLPISRHPNIGGSIDLSTDMHGWTGAVANITITKHTRRMMEMDDMDDDDDTMMEDETNNTSTY